MVLSVMLSMVKSFMGGTLTFERFMLELCSSFEICKIQVFDVLKNRREVVVELETFGIEL